VRHVEVLRSEIKVNSEFISVVLLFTSLFLKTIGWPRERGGGGGLDPRLMTYVSVRVSVPKTLY
jgi:hypothetical protein